MDAERTCKRITELASGNPREIFRGQTSLRSVLGEQAAGRHDILDSCAEVITYETDQDYIFRVYFPALYLYGNELIHLLLLSRPGSNLDYRSQSRQGILADWDIVKDGFYNDLAARHAKSLGAHWTEFVQVHRANFRDAVAGFSSFQIDEAFNFALDTYLSRDQAMAMMEILLAEVYEDGHGLSLQQFLEYNPDILERWMRLSGKLPDGLELKSAGVSKELVRELIMSVPEEVKENIYKERDLLLRKFTILSDVDAPSSRFLGRTTNDSDLWIEKLGEGKVRLSINDSHMVLDLSGDRPKEVEKCVIDGEEKGLAPLMVWSKDKRSDKRVYYCGQIDSFISEGLDTRANALLGLIICAHLSPAINEKLQSRKRLKGRRFPNVRANDMREAQVPVFVSLYRNRFLDGPVFQALEEFALA